MTGRVFPPRVTVQLWDDIPPYGEPLGGRLVVDGISRGEWLYLTEADEMAATLNSDPHELSVFLAAWPKEEA